MQSSPLDFKTDYKIALFVAFLVLALWMIHLFYILIVPLSIISAILHIGFQTFLSTGLFITAHDSMHGIAAPGKPSLNRKLGAVAIFLYGGFSYDKLLSSHLAHHKNPASVLDPDFTTHKNEKFLPWIFEFGRRYYGSAEYLKMHIHVLFVWLIGGALWKVFAFFAVPAWLSALQLFYFGTYLPHRTEVANPHPNLHRARSNSMPLLLSFITCYHFGYHLEHHENPNSPWWTLPRIKFYRLAGK